MIEEYELDWFWIIVSTLLFTLLPSIRNLNPLNSWGRNQSVTHWKLAVLLVSVLQYRVVLHVLPGGTQNLFQEFQKVRLVPDGISCYRAVLHFCSKIPEGVTA